MQAIMIKGKIFLMDKRKVTTSSLPRLNAVPRPGLSKKLETQKQFSKLWLWTAILLVVGIIVVSVVSLNAASLLKNVQIPGIVGQTPTVIPVTTLQVQRTASYADLAVTVVNAQYALFFPDDDIHQGQATVRLNIQVANHSSSQVNIVYYDIAHLLGANSNALIPTNTHLSVGPKPGTQENGWLDFSLPNKGVNLNLLTLQLGSTTLNETLVKIPFTGIFNPSQYATHTSPQTTTISYTFFGHMLTYHLTGIETRLAYQGVQCKAGQQFYVLNFKVDNVESGDISPGFGFDYIRLVSPGNERPPIDNSLPYTFKAGAKGVSGHVVFSAPKGMKGLTIGFLSQNGNGEQDTDVKL
ncbi:MAG: hypothetical protein NVS4B1_20190 [Ktedonobacteraceae bacterium]